MKRAMAVAALVVVAGGCKKEKADATPGGSPECASKAAELRSYLAAVFDPAQKPAPPWPTGDAALDAEIEAARARVREAAKPADPAAPAARLTPGVNDPLLGDLADCPPARAQLQKVGAAPPAERSAAMVAIADAVASCNCTLSIPRLKAALYLGQRGPD